MKKVFSLLFCAAALFSLSSCSDNNDELNGDSLPSGSQLYILNNGSFGKNNATMGSYSFETETSVDCLFSLKNGRELGDTAQDFIVYDDKIFIALYGSGIIFVTDLEGTLIEEITSDTYFSPRSFTSDDENVYVSYFDGGVAKIDPETYETTIVPASINPDKLVAVDGKLYVTVSQFYGNTNPCNTIDIYDAKTLKMEKSIEVVLNPTQVEADSEGNVYVLSMGDYGATAVQTLQKIDAKTDAVTKLSISGVEDALPSNIAMGKDDVLYVTEGVSNASTDWKMVGSVYAYDTKTAKVKEFISDDTVIPNIFSLSTDLVSGEVYVGSSDYKNTGDLYVLNADGTLKATIGTGVNPAKAIAVDLEE